LPALTPDGGAELVREKPLLSGTIAEAVVTLRQLPPRRVAARRRRPGAAGLVPQFGGEKAIAADRGAGADCKQRQHLDRYRGL